MPRRLLMVDPKHFDVLYVINPHMAGHVGTVDKARARSQWSQLLEGYRRIGMDVSVLEGTAGFPDMVFCANQSFPILDPDGGRHVVMSRMKRPERQGEVAFIEAWYHAQGYAVQHPSGDDGDFEGMGDAIWHMGRRLLWGGYGYRTSPGVYSRLADLAQAPIILLELTDPDFYHLDTCFCMLDEHHALIFPDAFTEEGLALIHALIPHVIEANGEEARRGFAVNAFCPDGRNVFIQKGCDNTYRDLEGHGFIVHACDTDEFIKSGGSVFCMKMQLW